ncbi:putative glycolipid-binding domain-containing protein [Micromonospora sp. HM5-17]|jgi:hypothetical protein|uniref:putative glycolipid-binding domain-containing protein n=1 Tax=Micromonospora sp. HM5-17 TaxID=2487710 RepID=UPI000F48CC88|nr:putative glycolipid-binding domain-containing protein [Micromonospora sp. HM5-17]ROT33898.1 hypothetical protein EF879_03080 [Micromonospora sp. HM5-17]
MSPTPKSLYWVRTDVPGADHAIVDDRRGFDARGTILAVDPIPFTCRYELHTDADWATEGLDVSCEGAGWLRTLHLTRAAGRWRASTAERGDLDAVLAEAGHPTAGPPGTDEPHRLAEARDVDLGGSPLFNTPPVRRLGLGTAPPGTSRTVTVAWVLVPSLRVMPVEQTYTTLDRHVVRFDSAGFTADIALDPEDYVLHYPGLAQRRG